MSQLKLYYHEPSNRLGLAEDPWDYVCLVKTVAVAVSGQIKYVEHQAMLPKTPEWTAIGEF